MLDGAALKRFERRLAAAVNASPKVGERIMYGSDFHLLVRVPRYERIIKVLHRMFDDNPVLKPFRDSFFSRNACRYLNLPAFIERNRTILSAAEIQHLRAVSAGCA